MPKKILNLWLNSDTSTATPLTGATIFGTPAMDAGPLKLIGYTDVNGNIVLDTDEDLEYIITALYLTENNLIITSQTPSSAAPTDFQSMQNLLGTIPSTPGTTTIITDPTVIAQQNAAANGLSTASTTTIGYYDFDLFLSQAPYNQNSDAIARISSAELTNSSGDNKSVYLTLTSEARSSQYFPTPAQVSKIPLANLPSYNTVTDIPRITLAPEPDVTTTATAQINTEIATENNKSLEKTLGAQLTPQARLANLLNSKKNQIKRKIIPFLIALLLPFGAAVVQGILAKLPLSTLKDLASCPNQTELLRIIKKRNSLVKQINAVYKVVTTLAKISLGASVAITALRVGILAITVIPFPAPPVVPVGVAKLEELLKKLNVVVNITTVTLATIGTLLGVILNILNSLDALIQQCAQEQEVPFEAINTELNDFVNESTGINNSNVIQATQNDNIYKGFTLELKLDATSGSSYPRRFAQALNKQGTPVLKTDSSFASDPQVLLDQLKFIIDSNPQLTAE